MTVGEDLWKRYPRRAPEVLEEAVGEEDVVLCHPFREEVLLLNEMGAVLWELCEGERTLEDIVGEIVHSLDADEEQVRADVVAFVVDVKGRGFLNLDEMPASVSGASTIVRESAKLAPPMPDPET